MFEGRGPLMILLLVLIGGLALNLTPCVLPMIPINLAIIGAGAQAGSRTRGFMLGSAYGTAMALVYGAIGLVVILTAGTRSEERRVGKECRHGGSGDDGKIKGEETRRSVAVSTMPYSLTRLP